MEQYVDELAAATSVPPLAGDITTQTSSHTPLCEDVQIARIVRPWEPNLKCLPGLAISPDTRSHKSDAPN